MVSPGEHVCCIDRSSINWIAYTVLMLPGTKCALNSDCNSALGTSSFSTTIT